MLRAGRVSWSHGWSSVGLDESGLLMRRFVGVVLAFGAVLVLASCSGRTTGATGITEISATLHATGRCDSGETCRWYWEYWRANQPRSTSTKTPVQGPVTGPTGHRTLSADITGLNPARLIAGCFAGRRTTGGSMSALVLMASSARRRLTRHRTMRRSHRYKPPPRRLEDPEHP